MTEVDYRIENWPKRAQTEFWIRFYANYIPRILIAMVRNKRDITEENKDTWAVPLYESMYSHLKESD